MEFKLYNNYLYIKYKQMLQKHKKWQEKQTWKNFRKRMKIIRNILGLRRDENDLKYRVKSNNEAYKDIEKS